MPPSRRVFACGHGSTPNGGRSAHVLRPPIWARSANSFSAANHADPCAQPRYFSWLANSRPRWGPDRRQTGTHRAVILSDGLKG